MCSSDLAARSGTRSKRWADTTRMTRESIMHCKGTAMNGIRRSSAIWFLSLAFVFGAWGDAGAARPLVIVTSPAVKEAIEALGKAFEAAHPDVVVQVAVDTSLDLRRTIAGMENQGRFFIGSGPIHLVAPGEIGRAHV